MKKQSLKITITKPTGISLESLFTTIWIVSMVAFLIQISLVIGIKNSVPWVGGVILINILLGVICFLGLLVSKLDKLTGVRLSSKTFNLWSLSIIYLLLAVIPVLAAGGTSLTKRQNGINTPTSKVSTFITPNPAVQVKQKTNTVNTSSQIDCIGPDDKVFKTTQKECDKLNTAWGNPPTLNPDETVKCNISSSCGGGYKEMLRKSCDEIVCCLLKNGNILTSQSDCKNKQFNECVENLTSVGFYLGNAIDYCEK